MVYRLTQNMKSWPEGACISELMFSGIYYLDRPLFETIQQFEEKDMIKYEDEGYCRSNGFLYLLFYTQQEFQRFLNSRIESDIIN